MDPNADPTGHHLTANGYPRHLHLNPESVLRAEVQDGALVVGAARLRVLVLSQVERIPPEVARRLQEIRRGRSSGGVCGPRA